MEYENLITDKHDVTALMLLLNELNREVGWKMYSTDKKKRVNIVLLDFDVNKKLRVICDMEDEDYEEIEETIKIFNADSKIKEIVKKALKKLYGYENEFYFSGSPY